MPAIIDHNGPHPRVHEKHNCIAACLLQKRLQMLQVVHCNATMARSLAALSVGKDVGLHGRECMQQQLRVCAHHTLQHLAARAV
jgi:hypothetical protein